MFVESILSPVSSDPFYSFCTLYHVFMNRARRLEVLIGDTAILDYFRANDPGCNLRLLGDSIFDDAYAVGFKRGFPLKVRSLFSFLFLSLCSCFSCDKINWLISSSFDLIIWEWEPLFFLLYATWSNTFFLPRMRSLISSSNTTRMDSLISYNANGSFPFLSFLPTASLQSTSIQYLLYLRYISFPLFPS